MKKYLVFMLLFVLVISLLTACDGGNANNGNNNGNNQGQSNSGGNNGISIASMKKAAKDAGYTVSDEYSNAWDGAVDGFTITYKNITTYVFEFPDAATADKYAEIELDAGYNHPVKNGKFFAIASIDDDEEIKFFEDLLNGRTIEKASSE